ncbi:MAG: DPP IV N-terminal domain-containing protein [Pseudomonadota bacterium]
MKVLGCWSVAIVLGLLAWGNEKAEAADPSLKWRTLVTPHFYVHYYSSIRHNEAEVAQRVARRAEKAHAVLAPILRHSPSRRTHIVVTDDTDSANGSAQIIPMNIVRVFVTGPSSLGALNDYDDWLYGLLIHEYTHVLHIDTISGIPSLLNAVLGKTWAPNQIQPRWFIEGLAVYEESARTAGGRNRSNVFDMYMRMAVLENNFLGLDQISSNTRYYPRGVVPYLYGSRFLKYIADRFGEEKLVEIGHAYGSRPIPYSLNTIAKKILGRTYVELWGDFEKHLKEHFQKQLAEVQQRGLTEFRKITDFGEYCGPPRFSPDGKELVFVDDDGGEKHRTIKILDAATGGIKESYYSYGGGNIDISPDGRFMVYGEPVDWRTFHDYLDLYVRDRRTGNVRRLTFGARSSDPAISPDGRQVVYVANELGNNSLAVIPFEGGKSRVLLNGHRGDQFFTPRWSSDGRFLVFSRWRAGGDRDIYLMDMSNQHLSQITADRALDVDPQFSADGQRIYFSSDRNNIFNLYVYGLKSKQVRQVTNVVGGAFSPAISPDEKSVFYVGYSSKGYDLHAMNIAIGEFLPALPYVNKRPTPPVIKDETIYASEPYSPATSVLPQNWMFSVGRDSVGPVLGIELQGQDVIGRHTYFLDFTANVGNGHPFYALSYNYNRFWPSIYLSASRYEGDRGGVKTDGEDGKYKEENYGASLQIGLPVLRIPDHSVSLSAKYLFNWYRDASQTNVLVEPGMVSPRLPDVGLLSGGGVGVSYSNVERFTWSISAERGRAINLDLRVNNESLGSDFSSTQITWSWTEYLPIPWFDQHVLAVRLAGGISVGDSYRRGSFTVGGFPEQNVFEAIIETAPLGGNYLRGYAPGVFYGDQYHLLNLEYRLPLFNIEHGIFSLPLYFNHVHLALFTDVGNAFFDELDFEALNVGVGAELLVEWVIGYVIPLTFRIGYARGLMEKGSDEFHFLIGRQF